MKILLIGNQKGAEIARSLLNSKYEIAQTISLDDGYEEFDFSPNFLQQFDFVIVSIPERITSLRIQRILLAIRKDPSKPSILNLFSVSHALAPQMRVDLIMRNPDHASYDGLILGISHSEVGLLPPFMKKHGDFCNLAISSQDIYYNYKTLEHCVLHYPQKICNLKYVILDLFDYSYFNYDVTMSVTAEAYISYGGYRLDPHNFAKNKHFSKSYENTVATISASFYPGLAEGAEAWKTLFDQTKANDYVLHVKPDLGMETRFQQATEGELERYDPNTSIVRHEFPDTLEENIQIFYRLLKLIYGINPSMKVYLILIPRYIKAQEKAAPYLEHWKGFFEDTLAEFNKTFPFRFIDLQSHPVANVAEYYQDVAHLNLPGAIELSRYLDDQLE